MLIRFLITACILVLGCTLSNAQKKDHDPLDAVIAELTAGRTEKALAALDEFIKQNPKSADAYFLRGSLTMESDPAQALKDFDKVIELKPDSGQAYNQRAVLRLTSNDKAGALKDLDAAIAHDFKDDSIYYLRGHLRWETGELKAAVSDLDEAIKLNPGNPRVYSTRGQVLVELKEIDRGLADFNYLIKWYETDPSARPVPKSVTANSAKPQPGAGFMVQMDQQSVNPAPGAKEMAPIIANVYANRGVILSERGNHVGALSDFNTALRIHPENVWALFARANEHEYKGDLPAALADIEKAIQIEPNAGNFLVERGVLLLLMGRDKDAHADFERLLQSDRALWQKRIDERMAAVRKIVPVK